jgi:hypothetical protein
VSLKYLFIAKFLRSFFLYISKHFFFVGKFYASSQVSECGDVFITQSVEEVAEAFVFPFHCKEFFVDACFDGQRLEAHN